MQKQSKRTLLYLINRLTSSLRTLCKHVDAYGMTFPYSSRVGALIMIMVMNALVVLVIIDICGRLLVAVRCGAVQCGAIIFLCCPLQSGKSYRVSHSQHTVLVVCPTELQVRRSDLRTVSVGNMQYRERFG